MMTDQPTPDEMRALLLELGTTPYKARSLGGKRAGMTAITLNLPTATVKRLWAMTAALKEAQMPLEWRQEQLS